MAAVEGFVLRNEKVANLSKTGFWFNHESSEGKLPFVHRKEVIDAIQAGGAVEWGIGPRQAERAIYDPEKPEGEQVRLTGEIIELSHKPGGRESYVGAVERLAKLLKPPT
jgi:hypothetical protein